MPISALSSKSFAADIAPEQLAGNANLTEAQKVAEGARQFEAMLLRQILQQTQKTVIQSKFSNNSTSGSIYRDLVTQQLADSISKSGSLGLAKSLEGQLTNQLLQTSAAGQNPDSTALPASRVGLVAGRPSVDDAAPGVTRSQCLPPADGVAVAPAHRP